MTLRLELTLYSSIANAEAISVALLWNDHRLLAWWMVVSAVSRGEDD